MRIPSPSRLGRPLVGLALLGASSPALAGGLGLVATGGMHQESAYYYNVEGVQGVDSQLRPNFGLGGEAVLGGRNDKVMGVFRLYASNEAQAQNPDLSAETADVSTFTHPDYDALENKTVGIMSVGIQWGILGDPTGFQFGVTTLVGSGFITKDNLEFFQAEPGAFVTYTLQDRIQLMGNLAGTLRYRKALNMGGNGYVGVRYLFD